VQFHFLFLNISGGEIVVVLLLVIMFFGANKLPEIARGLGKGIRQVRNATDEIKQEKRKKD
jgi:sec-independent protein translocase protein TatA